MGGAVLPDDPGYGGQGVVAFGEGIPVDIYRAGVETYGRKPFADTVDGGPQGIGAHELAQLGDRYLLPVMLADAYSASYPTVG